MSSPNLSSPKPLRRSPSSPQPTTTSSSPDPENNTTPRSAAIAKLRRAASTRGTSPSPSSSSPDGTSPTPTPDAPLFTSPPHPHPPPPSLQRTASLLARSTALAKLEGSAPPAPPATFFSPSAGERDGEGQEPLLPSLEELRRRAEERLRVFREGGGGRRALGGGGGRGVMVMEKEKEEGDQRQEARVNLMRTLSGRRVVKEKEGGGGSPERERERMRSGRGASGNGDGKGSPRGGMTESGDRAPEEEKEGPTPFGGGVQQAHHQHQHQQDDPSSSSNNSSNRNSWEMITPQLGDSGPGGGDAFEPSTSQFVTHPPSPPPPLPSQAQPQQHQPPPQSQFHFDPRAAAARATAAAAASSSHRALSAANYPLPLPPSSSATSVPSILLLRQPPSQIIAGPNGSAIATTALGLPSRSPEAGRPKPAMASFGIRAVEGSSGEDGDGEEEVRRRGSSASSSVAFLVDPLGSGARRVRGSGAGLGLGVGAGGGGARNDSVGSSEGMLGLGLGVGLRPDYYATTTMTMMGGGGGGSRGSSFSAPSTPAAVEQERENPMIQVAASEEEMVDGDGDAWSSTKMREQRLSAKVEKKREAGLARSKEGAFPPPEEGYQFPSPTMGGPRDSMDEPGSSTSPSQDVKGLFDKLGSPRSRNRTSPFLPPPTSPFLPTYMPRSLPGGPALPITSSPNLPREPISPTSVEPEPYQQFSTPVGSPASASLERTASTESSNKKKWFNAAAMFKSSKGGASPKTTAGSTEMQRQDSNRSTRSTLPGGGGAQREYMDAPETVRSGDSNYSSSTEMRRDFSGSSLDSYLPVQPRHHPLPAEELPSNKILARLDSLLAPPPSEGSTNALDNPPRKLLLHTPVLQVVNAHTVKDRHLFLFTDLLLITKPLIEDDPVTGSPLPVALDTSFLVKSIVELDHLHVIAASDPVEPRERDQKRHPLLLTFIDRFANDPKKAIGALIQRGNLSNDAQTIAHLIFKNPELNRNQVGAYFADPANRHILRAYIERFRFSGVRIDDALRMFLMSLRLPHNVEAAEYVLGVVAMQWIETNGQCGFDPRLTLSLILAIMRLSDALHSGANGNDGTFSQPNPTISVDDFIASFRELDPRLLVPEDLLTRIYASVRKERIEQASDNSIFSMTPDIEATMSPARLPMSLTYRAQSDPITISIPEPDPKFSIKLHGTDLKFDPPLLSFAKSSTQTFRVTGTALGPKAMVLIKVGANAPRYQGLPLNKVFSIERAFMQHTFQVSFTNHLDVKRKYMFSTLDPSVRSTWLRLVRERTTACLQRPPPPTAALQAAEAVAVQVLRDSLIQPEDTVPVTPSAAPSPRPNTAAPKFGSSSAVAQQPPRSRLGTPTRAGAGTLVRTNSFSKTYAHNFKVESDLAPDVRKTGGGGNLGIGGGSGMATPTRRGSKDESAALAALAKNPFTKKGSDIVLTTEQNSLLPLVLSFLGAGLPAAPLPVSAQGSAFQLPPLPTKQGEAPPSFSFISQTSPTPSYQ